MPLLLRLCVCALCGGVVVHLIIEHSAELMRIQGPLGFWSQQSFEASHKLTKGNFSRSSSHGGGKSTNTFSNSALYQMMAKHGRMFVSAMRQAIRRTTPSAVPYQLWLALKAEFAPGGKELIQHDKVRASSGSRIMRELPVLIYGSCSDFKTPTVFKRKPKIVTTTPTTVSGTNPAIFETPPQLSAAADAVVTMLEEEFCVYNTTLSETALNLDLGITDRETVATW